MHKQCIARLKGRSPDSSNGSVVSSRSHDARVSPPRRRRFRSMSAGSVRKGSRRSAPPRVARSGVTDAGAVANLVVRGRQDQRFDAARFVAMMVLAVYVRGDHAVRGDGLRSRNRRRKPVARREGLRRRAGLRPRKSKDRSPKRSVRPRHGDRHLGVERGVAAGSPVAVRGFVGEWQVVKGAG